MTKKRQSTDREEREQRPGERLQKLIARAGIASRRGAEELIEAGRVTVNGRLATLGDRADPQSDAVKVDGRLLRMPERHLYLLLNKPEGYLTTRADDKGRRTVLDLVPASRRRGLFPVGRLDFKTEGLLLLTTDGDFAQRISHPRHGCTKTYVVKVRGVPGAEDLDRLQRGIRLEGRPTAPCRIASYRPEKGSRRLKENSWWTVELGEGRSRQIRLMFQRIGHPVQRLRRVAIGPLRDPRLPPGACRELTAKEVEILQKPTKRRIRSQPAKKKAPASKSARSATRGTKGGSAAKPRPGKGSSRGRRK